MNKGVLAMTVGTAWWGNALAAGRIGAKMGRSGPLVALAGVMAGAGRPEPEVSGAICTGVPATARMVWTGPRAPPMSTSTIARRGNRGIATGTTISRSGTIPGRELAERLDEDAAPGAA